jgi:hypothetical protein
VKSRVTPLAIFAQPIGGCQFLMMILETEIFSILTLFLAVMVRGQLAHQWLTGYSLECLEVCFLVGDTHYCLSGSRAGMATFWRVLTNTA